METLAVALAVNYPGDRLYTLQSLTEELALMERHIRDGSWRLCSCNPEKHLPLVAGLASEGFGFAESDDEKRFMTSLMAEARGFKEKILSGEYSSQEQMDLVRAWAREARHRIEEQRWDIAEQGNPLSLRDIEEQSALRMVRELSHKYGTPVPQVRFTDQCNPAVPQGLHIQRDEPGRARPDLDEIILCRGSVNAYTVCHEFGHFLDHYEKGSTTEQSANEFALRETRNTFQNKRFIKQEHNQYSGGDAMSMRKGLTIIGGAALSEGYKMVEPSIAASVGADIAKGIKGLAGFGLLYYGVTKAKAPLDLLLGVLGGSMIVSAAKDFFAPAATLRYAAPMGPAPGSPVALPMAPGRAVISAPIPGTMTWRTPEHMTAGYPIVAQVDHEKFVRINV